MCTPCLARQGCTWTVFGIRAYHVDEVLVAVETRPAYFRRRTMRHAPVAASPRVQDARRNSAGRRPA